MAGVLQQGTRNCHSLLLAPGQFQAAFSDFGLIAIGQRHDEVVDMSRAGGILDLFPAGPCSPVENVVEDRVVEQHGILGHDCDGGAQRLLRVIANVATVDTDEARVDVIESIEKSGQGRFPEPECPTTAIVPPDAISKSMPCKISRRES